MSYKIDHFNMPRMRGELNPGSVLKEKDIHRIRRLVAAKKKTKVELAKEYGVSASTIRRVCNRRRWGWVE